MTNSPLRIGSVGSGNCLRHYAAVIGELRKRGLAELVAACDVLPEKRDFVRDNFGIQHFTTDYRELISWDYVDLVLVIPTDLWHEPVARLAMEAGKHVFLEKPMALVLDETGRRTDLDASLASAAALVQLARRGPGYLACAPFVVLSPTYQAMWRTLRRGDLGKLLSARAIYGTRAPGYRWVHLPGGGPLFNIAIYNITSLTGFLGPVRRVSAFAGVSLPQHRVEGELTDYQAEEDAAQFLFDFGDSVFASACTGWNMRRQRAAAIELYAEEGSVQMLGYDWAPQGYELWSEADRVWKLYPETNPIWTWADGMRHFVECIWAAKPPQAMLDHAFHVHEVILKAKASAREGRVIPVESTFDPTALLDWGL